MTLRIPTLAALLALTAATPALAAEPFVYPENSPTIRNLNDQQASPSPLVAPLTQQSSALPQVMNNGTVSYVTGGIGEEERTALESVRQNYNLWVMSADRNGAFAGDTQLIIRDRNGAEMVNTEIGPLFYAQLPAGRYTLEGQTSGEMKKQNITIGSARNTPVKVHFTWKAESDRTYSALQY